ncbi:hypothetical protein OH76DRAFT_1070045 [Lentinus brumalis]|uniref:Uncharacterized protein n=1 Tax=Lentinus brumalis TaxID=2498619 RepID=A0A371DNR6_9APHY|nr:hypothetical protein OH76DRAFT_1070045 [Polyporus brumalis]
MEPPSFSDVSITSGTRRDGCIYSIYVWPGTIRHGIILRLLMFTKGGLPDLWMVAFWTPDVASRRCVFLPWTHVDVQLPSNLWRFSHGLPSHRPACASGGPNPGILRGQCAHTCSPTENIEPSRTHGVAAPQLPVMRCPTLYVCGIRPLPAPRLPVPCCRDRNPDTRTPHS